MKRPLPRGEARQIVSAFVHLTRFAYPTGLRDVTQLSGLANYEMFFSVRSYGSVVMHVLIVRILQ